MTKQQRELKDYYMAEETGWKMHNVSFMGRAPEICVLYFVC